MTIAEGFYGCESKDKNGEFTRTSWTHGDPTHAHSACKSVLRGQLGLPPTAYFRDDPDPCLVRR